MVDFRDYQQRYKRYDLNNNNNFSGYVAIIFYKLFLMNEIILGYHIV